MASVSDPSKTLKSVVTSLQKSLECPICLETVKTPFKLCVNGHAVCKECIAKLEKCVLCQEPLTLENLVCVKSILEALPHLCRNSDAGCEEVVGPGNDHERFCSFRPIVCRSIDCSEKVSVCKLIDHYKTQHPIDFIIEETRLLTPWEYDNDEDVFYTPVFIFDNIFWIIDVSNEKHLKTYFQATPTEKLNHDYYVCVSYIKGNFKYSYTLKASVLSSCDRKITTSGEIDLLDGQDVMKVPMNKIRILKEDDGDLRTYHFFRILK